MLASMTFRNTEEAIELANNTRYGLAASVWSENINLALHVAPQLKAGVVWINGTNMFDAACGFGGYRESGFGREGGKMHTDHGAVACADEAGGLGDVEMVQGSEDGPGLVRRVDRPVEIAVGADPVDCEDSA